jgi:CRISPR-associated protein Cmr5
MNSKINKLIPEAMNAIDKHLKNDNNKIPKEFKGYISSIGASIIQTGLLPTLAFYQNDDGKNADSSKLLKAILDILEPNHNNNQKLIDYAIAQTRINNNNNTVQNTDIDIEKLQILSDEIRDILVALKLALRTFKIDE